MVRSDGVAVAVGLTSGDADHRRAEPGHCQPSTRERLRLPENVRLYERFGYEVTAEAIVLGVTSWFMSREPRPLTGT